MKISRRTLIASGIASSTLGAVHLHVQKKATLVIFDGRFPQSRRFGRSAIRQIDVAKQDHLMWRDLRSTLPKGRVEGLTSWSDWVMVRGLLEEQGKRVKSERAENGLYRWTMA